MTDINYGTILTTIRKTEGSPAYNAKPKGSSSASGAYQFTDPTWLANGGGAYAPHAWQATQAQQDAVATRKVQAILAANNGDLGAVPQVWYLGHVASAAELDKVPGRGNKLTVRQYIQKWMGNYAGSALPSGGGGNVIGDIGGFAGDAVDKTARAVVGLLGALVDPFVQGLRRLTIIGLATALGVGLVGFGAWRSVRPASG